MSKELPIKSFEDLNFGDKVSIIIDGREMKYKNLKVLEYSKEFGLLMEFDSHDDRETNFEVSTGHTNNFPKVADYLNNMNFDRKIADTWTTLNLNFLYYRNIKVANTKIARRMYKDRIVEETSRHLTINMV